jgi:O-methyltransferase involved in polyketide biosynthesis
MKEKNHEIDLSSVEETLFLPLWARAKDAEKENPILGDSYARNIVAGIDYDFSKIETEQTENHKIIWPIRALNFDTIIRKFLEQFSEAIVINLGAGLDTSFQRLDNGKVQWFNIELPDVAALRQKLIPDSERETTIGNSIFDFTWKDDISRQTKGRSVMFMAAGVLCYFEDSEVKALFHKLADFFPGAHFIFDAFSRFSIWATNLTIMSKKGIDSSARLKWHLNKASRLKKWINTIQVLEEYSMLSAIEPDEDWDKKVVRDLKIAKALRMNRFYRIVHVQFSET